MAKIRLLRALLVALPLLAQGSAGAAESRNEAYFNHWVTEQNRSAAVAVFHDYLERQGVSDVVPLYQLLRTASDWNEPKCRKVDAPPFQIPEREKWAHTVRTLKLVRLLSNQRILISFEVVSAYRDVVVDKCAGGSGLRHPQAGAFDLLMPPSEQQVTAKRLCNFYWKEGAQYQMGLSQYPSGRFHIDTVRHSTWGAGGRGSTSVCKR